MQSVVGIIIAIAIFLGGLAYLLNTDSGNNMINAVMNRLSVGQTRENLEGAAKAIRDSEEDTQRQEARDRMDSQQGKLRDSMDDAATRQEQMQDRLRAMQERMNR